MEVDVIIKKAVDYVEKTQPMLDKMAAADERFIKEAAEAVEDLCSNGLIAPQDKQTLLDKIAEDKTAVFKVMRRLSGMAASPALGVPSELTKLSEDTSDPFVRAFCPEFVTQPGASGMID